MKKITLLILTMILGLQGCNSSSDGSNKTKNPPVVPTKPTTPPVVHMIKPSDVANYIDDFKLEQRRLELVFNSVTSKITYVEKTKDSIILKYDQGLAVLGYDSDKDKLLPSLTLLEGDTSDLDNFKSTRTLTSSDISVDGDDHLTIYTGTVQDGESKGLYSISIQINESILEAGDSKLVINGSKATLSGTLGTSTYIQIQKMIKTTSVDTLILSNIPGSVNDAINMHTGRLIRNASLATVIPKDGDVNSGGVDLFAAGILRVYQDGGKVGVHSWCCTADGKDAGQLSKDDKAHGAQLTYFREMLGAKKGPEFYFFTIKAAPAKEIHLMTSQEMAKYNLTMP
ncbi:MULTISPECIES: hypothetical protein [unclassified Moritella]|uniref:hypothetical protein n=1 Tax=unclassified Moritella TaxID=2637987 RepID=UPI001BA759FB|nr:MULTISPECIES: hypothetical protein [unclassified Moritella]QUM86075.1 hypothetical protein HWV02_16945 [Moritella sp. 28]QUM90314.1 hypothetical protein HWV03_16670 [Moritella sp. 36]